MIKQKLQTAGWIALGLCCIVLLVAAVKTKDHKTCSSIKVAIKGAADNVFVSENDIRYLLTQNHIAKGEDISTLDLRAVENQLEKNAWIKDAELYVDNRQVLYAVLTEREPLARIFTVPGTSFYIDSACKRLPLSETAIARIPVFTGFPSGNKRLSAPDSMLLKDIRNIAAFVASDTFWSAQVAQVSITPNGNFEMIPTLGNQVIELGDASDIPEKFGKLLCFYQQVWNKVGFEKYERISVQYKGQVVAVRRGAPRPATDTVSAVRLLASADKKLTAAINDTATSVVISKPATAAKSTTVKAATAKKTGDSKTTGTKTAAKQTGSSHTTAKPSSKTTKDTKQKPKAVMKKPSG